MKAAIYSQVSTNEKGTDNQVPVVKAWAKQWDFEVVKYYIDNESSNLR